MDDTIMKQCTMRALTRNTEEWCGNAYLKKTLGFQQEFFKNSRNIIDLDIKYSNILRDKKMAVTLLPSFTLSAWLL